MNNFLESLRCYFKDNSREKILEDWAKTEEFDQVGISVEDFLNIIKEYRLSVMKTNYEKFKDKFSDLTHFANMSVDEFKRIKADADKVMLRCQVIEHVYNYEVTDDVFEEICYSESEDFVRGKYAYMAMVLDEGVRKCVGVAYNIDYCLKLACRFLKNHPEITFTHINKVLWGELKEEKKIFIKEKK